MKRVSIVLAVLVLLLPFAASAAGPFLAVGDPAGMVCQERVLTMGTTVVPFPPGARWDLAQFSAGRHGAVVSGLCVEGGGEPARMATRMALYVSWSSWSPAWDKAEQEVIRVETYKAEVLP